MQLSFKGAEDSVVSDDASIQVYICECCLGVGQNNPDKQGLCRVLSMDIPLCSWSSTSGPNALPEAKDERDGSACQGHTPNQSCCMLGCQLPRLQTQPVCLNMRLCRGKSLSLALPRTAKAVARGIV